MVAGSSANGQAPTGSIAGVVRDPSGAAVSKALIKLTNLANGMARQVVTAGQGDYTFPALVPATYELSTDVEGFMPIVRSATVEAGVTTNADFDLVVGGAKVLITIEVASPQMRYDSHTVGGVVTERQIQGLPFNGRSFLDSAKLEPGVQPPARASSNRLFVPALGQPQGNSGRGTRVTVDGGSIMAVGNGGSAMGFSQEVVQEFQIATVNFDLTTGLTSGAAINVVTRSAGNDFNGTAYYFFRDHTLAAHPALNRDSANPDPFFQRRQFGFALGGPIRRDRVFFFGNYERNEQRGVATTTLPGEFAHLSRITPSPYFGSEISLRIDGRISGRHTAFIRYSHEGVDAFGPRTSQQNAYPSSWTRQPLWGDQSILGLTSTFSDRLVNDFRFSYLYLNSSQVGLTERDCPGCLGIGAPAITVAQVSGMSIGSSIDQHTLARRYHFNNYLTWQWDSHRARFGIDWEYNRGGTVSLINEPASLELFSPQETVRAGFTPPSAFRTLDDILQLPLKTVMIGIGDARVTQEDGGLVRNWHTLRLFFQDTWRLHSRLTVNYGLGWSIDRNLNYDLSKPSLLAPLLGADSLGPTRKSWTNFSPVLGLVWTPWRESKTIVRAGAGYFYDFLFAPYLETERALLGPPSFGRQNISGDGLVNCLPGIPDVAEDRKLSFKEATRFSGANLLTCLPTIRAELARDLANKDRTIQTIQITKQSIAGLSPADLPNTTALHINLGIQREIVRDFVVSADFAYRHYDHVGMGQLDLNRFNRATGRGGPVIQGCTAAQVNDPQALCSNSTINVQENVGRLNYMGLLVRADKRFSHGFQLLGSWAYSSNAGTNSDRGNGSLSPGFNLDDWLGNRGPHDYDISHIVNLAGVMQLPRRFQLGFNFSYASAPPFSAFVGGTDFNGDGTKDDLLPGTTFNAFNRGLGRADLERLVIQFNQTYADKPDGTGKTIPNLSLPDQYWFGDNFQSLDLRLSREFVFEKRRSLTLIGEVFNLYNAANLSGHSGNLTTSNAFGRPTTRATQVFGSGGSRAFQLALRVNF